MRLNKFLSDAGVCSRRQADSMIEEGRITVDGRPAVVGEQVTENQKVCVDGKEVSLVKEKVILVFNKPKGIVCTAEKREKDNIIDYINYPERIYPVGRLDKDSHGLILLTNDGELMNEILRARNYHEKEYEVTVNRPITKAFLKQMSEGVEILDTVTRPCVVKQTGVCSFRIILTQGLNRQIRRMCEALDYRVRDLKRYRIMNVHLGNLELGKYRRLTSEEYADLIRLTGLEKNQDKSGIKNHKVNKKSGNQGRKRYVKKR